MATKFILEFRYKGATVTEYSHPLKAGIRDAAWDEANEWVKNKDHLPGNWDTYKVEEV